MPAGEVGGDPGQVAERARGKRLARPAVVLILGQPALGVAGLEHVDGAIPVSAGRPQVSVAPGGNPQPRSHGHRYLQLPDAASLTRASAVTVGWRRLGAVPGPVWGGAAWARLRVGWRRLVRLRGPH